MQVEIVVPKGADRRRTFDAGLIELTEAIARVAPDKVASGLLGGEFGYGALYENDHFMMHPHCWCEQDDCRWCQGCDCPAESMHYFVDGVEVGYEEWMASFKRECGDPPGGYGAAHHAWMQQAKLINARRQTVHDPVCDFCVKHGGENAPNFLHKPSGTEVRWYKYIGRDMAVKVAKGIDVRRVFAECVASVTP